MYSRIILTSALTLLCILPCFAAGSRDGGYSGSVLIENVSIIDPAVRDFKPVTGHVLMKEGSIVYAGSRRPKVSRDVKVIDGRGKFLIPGLIDSHAHLANIPGLNWKLWEKYPALAAAYYRQMPRSYLYFGYTTVIDLNNHSPEILDPILRETVRPEIFTCGQQLEVFGGFMMAEIEPADYYKKYPNFLVDRYNKGVSISEKIDPAEHTPRAAVQRVRNGQSGICVKMAFENGFGGTEDVTWQMPSREMVREVAAETRKAKIPLMLHANSFESQQFAVDTGVDVIAHGMWHWGLLKNFINVNELPQTHRALLEKIAELKIGYQPTFRVIAGQRDLFDDAFVDDPNLENVYPKEFLDWLKTDEGHWQQNQIKQYAKGFFDGQSNKQIAAFMQLLVDKIAVSAKVLADNDANLLLGTDTPSSNAHTNPPGYNGFLEMKEWYAAGISLRKILKAATFGNAAQFRIDGSVGSIRAGKSANLLLLNKNPLADIGAYDSIDLVIVRGNVFRRSDLSAKGKVDVKN